MGDLNKPDKKKSDKKNVKPVDINKLSDTVSDIDTNDKGKIQKALDDASGDLPHEATKPTGKKKDEHKVVFEFKFGLHFSSGAMKTKTIKAAGKDRADALANAEAELATLKTKMKFEKHNLQSGTKVG